MPSLSLSRLPAYELAKRKGFDLHATSGDKKTAYYVKDGVYLYATDEELELSFVYNLLTIGTSKFSHSADFDLFYGRVRAAKEKLAA